MIRKLLSLLLLMTLLACSANNSENKEVREITFASYEADCMGAFPQKCFIEILDSGEKQFFYDVIEGFHFEPGYQYKLSVNVIPRCDINNLIECPQDVGIYRYELNKILSKKPSDDILEKSLAKNFPEAKKGFKKVIIQLEKKENEQDYNVELFASKKSWIDCNSRFLMGAFEEKILDGWDYDYYEFASNGMSLSTRKGCGTPGKQGEIVSQGNIVRYNSSYPIVIYIREDMRVKYNIFRKKL